MDTIPSVGHKQVKPGLDLFFILPNLIVGSNPTQYSLNKKSITTKETNLKETLSVLATTFGQTLIVDLIGEKKPYDINQEYTSKIRLKWIHWLDYRSFPMKSFIELLHVIVDFLRKKQSGVFIHCKHGKGRTGTLVCGLLMFFCSVTPDMANNIFIKRRVLYNVGVKINSQLKMLKYWECLLNDPKISIIYQNLTKSNPEWRIGEFILKCNDGDLKSKKKVTVSIGCFKDDFSIQQLFEDCKVAINKTITCQCTVKDDVFVVVKYKHLVLKSYQSLGFNLPMELVIGKDIEKNHMVIKLDWKDMDGIKGTGFKGKQYFDKLIINIYK